MASSTILPLVQSANCATCRHVCPQDFAFVDVSTCTVFFFPLKTKHADPHFFHSNINFSLNPFLSAFLKVRYPTHSFSALFPHLYLSLCTTYQVFYLIMLATVCLPNQNASSIQRKLIDFPVSFPECKILAKECTDSKLFELRY